MDGLSTTRMGRPMCACAVPQQGHDPPAVHRLSYLSPHARLFILCFITRGNHTPGSRRNAARDPPQCKPSTAAIPNQRTCHAATTLSRLPAMATKGKTRNHNSTHNLARTVSSSPQAPANDSDRGRVVTILVGPS